MWIKRKEMISDCEPRCIPILQKDGSIVKDRLVHVLGKMCFKCASCQHWLNTLPVGYKLSSFTLPQETFDSMPVEVNDLKGLLLQYWVCLDLGWTLYAPKLDLSTPQTITKQKVK